MGGGEKNQIAASSPPPPPKKKRSLAMLTPAGGRTGRQWVPADQRDPGDAGPRREVGAYPEKSACGRTGSEGRRGTEHPKSRGGGDTGHVQGGAVRTRTSSRKSRRALAGAGFPKKKWFNLAGFPMASAGLNALRTQQIPEKRVGGNKGQIFEV